MYSEQITFKSYLSRRTNRQLSMLGYELPFCKRDRGMREALDNRDPPYPPIYMTGVII